MRVLLRCDGGGSLGVGHVMRSLALAEAAAAAGHEVVVVGRFEGSFLHGQLEAAPVEVVRLEAQEPALGLVPRLEPDVLHVDSYDLAERFEGGFVLSNMEDGAFGRRSADVVIDPNFGADLTPRRDHGSRFVLRGSRYTPIRQRVVDARRQGDVVDTVAGSVLVVMGGTDPVGLAPGAVNLLARTALALDVTVIAMGENAERVRSAARDSRLSLKVLPPVEDLPAIMARQDLVISAAGTTVWELCCLGVPMAVVWAVENQREGYERVVAAGAALGLGGPDLGGPDLGGPDLGGDRGAVALLRTALSEAGVRADLALAGRQIVDGLGAWRVVRTWEQAVRQPRGRTWAPEPLPAVTVAGLVARRATLEDGRLLWEWRNDPGTRAGSRFSAEVPWEDHQRWLTTSLSRTDRLLLVVEDEVGPVGTVRWDLEHQGEWEVSITVAPDRRGQSLASPLLRSGEAAVSDLARSGGTDVTAYLAVVHVDNEVSVRLFEASSYLPDLPPDAQGFMRFRKAARVA